MAELRCIRFGDSIGLVNGSFALATPSLHDEPITERVVQLSGMRAVSGNYSAIEAGFQFPSDYADRCIFKILPDKNATTDNRSKADVCFGSAVRLIHEPTGHALIASYVDHKQPGMPSLGKKMKCACLRKELTHDEEAASHWIIQSRYKLRREGDIVRVNDSVILKSIYHKDFFLSILNISTDDAILKDSQHMPFHGPHYVGITSDTSKISASGWLVKSFQCEEVKLVSTPSNLFQAQVAENAVDVERSIIRTGMYVRISHIESRGHVICRADDAKAVLSRVAPLGSIYRVQSGVRTETHGVYMRCPSGLSSSVDANAAHTNDCLNVWQILPQETDGLDVFKKVTNGQSVRIRHLISGQYLCVRPSTTNDAAVLRCESSINGRVGKIDESATRNPKSSTSSMAKKPPTPGTSATNNIIPFELYDLVNPSEFKKSDSLNAGKEKARQERLAFLEKVRSNSSVATTSEPDSSGLFAIFSCNYNTISSANGVESDPSPDIIKKFIAFEESVYLQHEYTSCRLKLHERGAGLQSSEEGNESQSNSDAQWPEYQGDIPLQPSDPSESKVSILLAANANACRLEEVDMEEVRDIMFAARFVPLLRTAITCVQSPTKERTVLPTTVYRQLNSGLYTLSQWSVLKGANEAYLTDNAARNKRPPSGKRKGSIVSVGDNSVISDNSDDEMEVASNVGRSRTLTVVERMDRVEYPTLLDNAHSHEGQHVHSSSIGRREKIDAVSRATIARRQSLLSDCRLLEMALHFANIVFTLVREKDPQLNELKYQLEETEEVEESIKLTEAVFNRNKFASLKRAVSLSACPAPQVLLDCCLGVHELIRSSTSLDNRRNAMKIVSIHGVMMSFLVHDIVGWNPTIENILVSARSSAKQHSERSHHTAHTAHGPATGDDSPLALNPRNPGEGARGTVKLGNANTEKLDYVSSEDIFGMVDQMLELKKSGESRTSVDILRLLAVLCAPGEVPDKQSQDIITDAIFAPILPGCSPFQPPVPSELTQFDTFKTVEGFLFSSRLSANGVWQVRATTDRKCTAASLSAAPHSGDVRQEILLRVEAYRSAKGSKDTSNGSESKVEKELLIDLLIDLGQVGGALKTTVSRLMGASVSELSAWIQERKQRDSLFSGLSHFTSILYDDIPVHAEHVEEQVHSRSSSVKTNDKTNDRMDANGSSKTNNSRASSTNVTKASKAGSASGGSIKGSVKGADSTKSNQSAEKAKAPMLETRDDHKILIAPKGTADKKLQVITEDYSDEADGEGDWGCGTVLSPVMEISDSSQSGYSSSSPALSDSEEDAEPRAQGGDSQSDSGDEMQLNRSSAQGIETRRARETLYDDDDDDSSEGSPTPTPASAFPTPHFPAFGHQSQKSENELGKIEEEDELYSDEEEEEDEDEERVFLSTPHHPPPPPPEWRDWTEALSDGSKDQMWLQRSLHLVSELCRDNFRAQKKSAHFLPPELLLGLLRSGKLTEDNRTLICRLLRNIYVENDFVFSSSPTGHHLSAPMVCGLSETHSPLQYRGGSESGSPIVAEEEVGKVFNMHSRLMFAGSSSGPELRSQLWVYLRHEVLSLKLNHGGVEEDERGLYFVSLLRLLKSLLVRGFFDEAESFLQVFKADLDNEPSSQTQSRCLKWMRQASDLYGNEFDVSAIQSHMVCTLQDWERSHDSIKGIAQIKRQGVGLGRGRGRESLTLAKLTDFMPHSALIASGKTNVMYVDDVNAYFNATFASKLQSSIVFEIVQILTETFGISQKCLTLSIAECLEGSIASSSKGGDPQEISESSFDISDSATQRIEHYLRSPFSFSSDRDRDRDRVGVTKAVLVGSLHGDDTLTASVYRLLHQHLTYEAGVARLAQETILVPTVSEGVLIRRTQNYGNLVLKGIDELLDRSVALSKDKKNFLTGTIAFILANIRNFFSDRSPSAINERARLLKSNMQGSFKNGSSFTLSNPMSPENILLRKAGKDKEGLSTKSGKSMRSAKSGKSGKSGKESLGPIEDPLGPSPLSNMRLEQTMRFVTSSDSENSCEELCGKLVAVVVRICAQKQSAVGAGVLNSNNNSCASLLKPTGSVDQGAKSKQKGKAWDNLLASEKFLVDEICCFLGEVGGGSRTLPLRWEASLGALAMQYWRVCDGAAQLLELLCAYCPFYGVGDTDQSFLLDSLMSRLLQADKKPFPMAPRILCSILLFEGPSRLKKITVSGLLCSGLKRLVDSPQMAISDTQTFAQSSVSLHTLRLIALLGLRTTHKEFSTCIGGSVMLKQDACVAQLTAEATPLLVKCFLLQISVRLYSMPITTVVNVMLMDMNGIQTQLAARTLGRTSSFVSKHPLGIKLPKSLQSTDSPFGSDKSGGTQDLTSCKASCAEYLFEGVLDTLSHMLLTTFPSITPAIVDAELRKLQQSSRSWGNHEREKASKRRSSRLSQPHSSVVHHSDRDSQESGEDSPHPLPRGSRSNSRAEGDGGADSVSDEGRDRRSFSSKVSSKLSMKSSYSRGTARVAGEESSSDVRSRTKGDHSVDGSMEMKDRAAKVAFRGLSSLTASFVSKPTSDAVKAGVEAEGFGLSMEARVQLVECVIILFDTLMSGDGLLFHTISFSSVGAIPGDFNLHQCKQLLRLCIGANVMLSVQKTAFLMPERAEKVAEILKSLVSHMFELQVRYNTLHSSSQCTKYLCKSALSTAIRTVIRSRNVTRVETPKQYTAETTGTSNSLAASETDRKAVDSRMPDAAHDEIENGSRGCMGLSRKKPAPAVNNDLRMFTDELELAPPISYDKLKKSSLYGVFKELLHSATGYLEGGGAVLVDIDGNAVKDMGAVMVDANPSLSRLTPFDAWLNGGARYLTVALGLITQTGFGPASRAHHDSHYCVTNSAVEVSSILFHIFILLLQNDVENIRKKVKDIKRRSARVAVELERVQRSQNTLHILGANTVVLRLLGRSYSLGRGAVLTSPIPPLALKLGSSLASRNGATQNAVLDCYNAAMVECVGQRAGSAAQIAACMKGIQRLLKITRAHIDVVRTQGPKHLNPCALKILLQMFSFCGMLCSGHNARSRHFLRDQDYVESETAQNHPPLKGNYDIVREIALAVNSLLSTAASMMKYVNNTHFNEYVAPLIWEAIPNSGRRRYIAWHDNRVDYLCVAQVIHTASTGFSCLTELSQGPCLENQKNVLLAVTKCPSLLEFLGSMQLEATSVVGSTLLGRKRKITLLGGHPGSFYRILLREVPPPDSVSPDSEWAMMQRAARQWKPSRADRLLRWGRTEEGAEHSSEDIIGVKLSLFKKIGKQAELKCLTMFLALLEATTDIVAVTLERCLRQDVMLQNMKNVYEKALKTGGSSSDFYRSAAVAYMTINMTLSSILSDKTNALLPGAATTSRVEEWVEKQTKDGRSDSSLLASVEIIGSDGRIQCVYFPVPSFVSLYWPYPEVQKAKESLIYKNNRDSPEEKLADFFVGMDGIWKVMRRQERLRRLLTPVVHAVFGGKSLGESVGLSRIIPPQRVIFFAISFFFNIYYSYESYYGYVLPSIPTSNNDDVKTNMFPQFMNYFWFWNLRSTAILVIAATHFGLGCSLALRGILNSRAADSLPDFIPGRNYFKKKTLANFLVSKGISILQAPRTPVVLCLDNLLPLMLVGCSGAALFAGRIWFYAPCLVDVLGQIRYMSFIVTALRRNTVTISLTILLVVLFLYFFSVGAYLFFPNQYDLSGHMDCNDIGSCFKVHLDYGFNNPPNWASPSYIQPDIVGLNQGTPLGILVSKFTGTLYNLIYTILINLVLQAIVSGLIIDTFSAMREENDSINADIKDRCFVCSIPRDEFEQAGLNFHTHVTVEHNMWKYLWFRLHLEAKDPLNFSGPEFYANTQMGEKQAFVHLLPVKRSLSLERVKRANKAKMQH